MVLDQLADLLGDHFLSGCRERQEARQQPQLAVLFRSEVVSLTTRFPDFPYSSSGAEVQDFLSCVSLGSLDQEWPGQLYPLVHSTPPGTEQVL